MPIDLPASRLDDEPPLPPRPIIWLSLLAAFLAVGAAWTLITWPGNAATWTPGFWMRLLVYPSLAWGVVFGLRLHRYEEACNYRAEQEKCRQDDYDEAIGFAREPLAVNGMAYVCAMASSGVAGRILRKESALEARAPRTPGPVTRHTRLDLAEDKAHADRYEPVIRKLLDKIRATVRGVPPRLPLDVRLHLPDEANPLQLLAAWTRCWADCGLRPVEVMLVPADEGLMALDTWLDVTGGPALERFTLYVAVQLHDKPPNSSAEAAVAMLLSWAPLARRHGLEAIAMLHRPVACETAELAAAISTTALYACVAPGDLHHLWYSGITKADKSALLKQGSEVGMAAAQADDLPGMHDLDTALGYAGVAAGWLTLALAIENACHGGEPQGIACRERALRLAVVRPVGRLNETESI